MTGKVSPACVGLVGQCHPQGLADWATPEWVVVSGGERDRAEEVQAAYRSRGPGQSRIELLHTQDAGAVTFAVSADGVQVRTYRTDHER